LAKNVVPKYGSMKKKNGMTEMVIPQKILSGNRITIPDEILKNWGLDIGSWVLVRKEGKGIYIAPAKLIEA